MADRFTPIYHPLVVRRDIPGLDPATRSRIRAAIEAKLTVQPEHFAKPLAHTRAGLWSLRVGSWRVIFALRRAEVWILRIAHRTEVYRRLDREIPERQ